MVRKYVRKTDRQSWSTTDMQQAVETVISGNFGVTIASRNFEVPKATLERYVKKARKEPNYKVVKRLGSIKKVFTDEQESEIVLYLTKMEAQLFGLTQNDVREFAYQLAVRNGIANPFTDDKAGKDWMSGFMERHPELSLRTPEATSAARAMGFNRVSVGKFFDLLTEIYNKYELTPDRIFNCDETGMSVNPKEHSKIIAMKGRRQVGTITSAERGQTVSACICFSAAGIFVPPTIIFPRVRMQQMFGIGLPPAATAVCNESGWMTKEVFFMWFEKFVEFSGATKDRPVLLMFDGHSTHTKNLDLIDFARESGVILLCFPPHCSHKLQPCDVSFMRPLSKFYEDETRKFLRTNPGRVITLSQIAPLFGSAYMLAANMRTAINGFRKSGIYPLNRNVFDDADFLPSLTTDIENPRNGNDQDSATETTNRTANESSSSAIEPTLPVAHGDQAFSLLPELRNITSEAETAVHASEKSFKVTPETIMPIPRISQSTNRVSKRRGTTAVLTTSPYRKRLREEIQKKVSNVNRKRKAADETSTEKKTKKTKRQIRPSRKSARNIHAL